MKMTRIIVITTIMLVFFATAFAAMPIGVVVGDSADQALIIRDGQTLPCKKGETLYEGDVIKGANAGSLEVDWHPYAKGQMISASELKVTYAPPGTMDLAMYKLKEFFGFVDGELQAQYAATRGGPEDALPTDYQQPGFNATVLPGQPVSFFWGEARGRAIVFENSKKQPLLRKEVRGQVTVELTPEEIGLVPGEACTWRVEGLYDSYKIKLADEATAKQISADLQKINEESGTDNEKTLKKAMYFQLISESTAGKIDMYWLSYRLLKTIDAGNDKNMQAKIELLKSRYAKHLDSTR